MSLPLDRIVDLDRLSLRDRVYDRILGMLLTGEVEAGARLSIDTMAKHLAVSPTPVREAMVQLERTGLVMREALKGYRVAPPLDAEQLAELFEARLMLETTAVRNATRVAAAVVPELKAAQARHRVASQAVVDVHQGDARVPLEVTQAYFAADSDFHQVVLAHSGNRYVRDMYESLGALTHRMRQSALRGPDDVQEAVAEHEAVVAAFETGDVEACVESMRKHIENVRARSLHGDR
ncbi:GntR family transcriptional regulator [Promicromonospora panici]|uniref:GntR family transcriptional regulator n=1 Tax=Promicromonospora panici TaxID=2219658 RepID=UPI00101E0145|nr:GntR family transcriptional regulator [Promicromonospora panici]